MMDAGAFQTIEAHSGTLRCRIGQWWRRIVTRRCRVDIWWHEVVYDGLEHVYLVKDVYIQYTAVEKVYIWHPAPDKVCVSCILVQNV